MKLNTYLQQFAARMIRKNNSNQNYVHSPILVKISQTYSTLNESLYDEQESDYQEI